MDATAGNNEFSDRALSVASLGVCWAEWRLLMAFDLISAGISPFYTDFPFLTPPLFDLVACSLTREFRRIFSRVLIERDKPFKSWN